FLLRSPEGRRLAGKLPLAFVGDGREPRFQDRPRGFLAAHSRSSLAELSRVMGAPVDEQRFRSNIAIEGLPAWAERDLVGRRVRIGEQEFDVQAPIVRCLAINANPDTGERDLRVLQSLTRDLGQAEPVFGVLLLPRTGTDYEEGEARVRVGEEHSVLRLPGPELRHQPRSESRCGTGSSSTLRPTIAAPSPRETSAITSGSS